MLETREQEPNTGTRSGFHFYDLHKKCGRKFFINYVKGIESKYTAPPLVLGGAFHLAKEMFYKGKTVQESILLCVDYIKKKEPLFYDPEQYGKVLNRCPQMFENWAEEVGRAILEEWDVFAAEQYIEASLPDTGYRITMRLDAILKHKKMTYHTIEETKSTQSSLDNMKLGVQLGDQSTLYTWGFKKAFPDLPLLGVIPDITFWSKSTQNPKLIKHYRGIHDIITRTKHDLRVWEIGMNHRIKLITEQTEAYLTNPCLETEHAFDKDTYWCNSYFKPCEYANICRCKDLDSLVSDDFIKVIPCKDLNKEVGG